MSTSIYGLLVIVFATLSCIGPARGEERIPSLEEATAQLLTLYGRNASHLARYEFRGNNKSLNCTVVRDELSGLMALNCITLKGGERSEFRMWNTDDDRFYISVDDELKVTRGMQEEMSVIQVLAKQLSPDPAKEIQMNAYLFLTTDSISVGMGFADAPTAPWKSSLKESSVHSVDEETITFKTQEHGLLSISRKTGILKRQMVKGKEDEERILVLKEFKREPGRKVIEEITKEWITLGAKDINIVPYTLPLRLTLFQRVITSVENGTSDLGKLEAMLRQQKKALRHFSELCAAHDVDSPIAQAFRRTQLPDKEAIRQAWIAKTGSKADDEKGFEEFLMSQDFRKEVSDQILKTTEGKPDYMNNVMTLILGKGVWDKIQTKDESGKAAKDLCGNAIARSYMELMLEHRMNQSWGRLDELD